MFLKKRKDKNVREIYDYWRIRIMTALMIGYSAFYIVRQNFSVAVPKMLSQLNYSKSQIGWIFTSFSIIYGFFKFFSGIICDRFNIRYFMTIGLIGASLINLMIGFSNSIIVIGLLYSLNGVLQSTGWPPVTRSLTHWYPTKKLGTRWGIINASHQIGSSIILNGGPLILTYFSWREVFIFPAIFCLICSIPVFYWLRDIPSSLGLPKVENINDKNFSNTKSSKKKIKNIKIYKNKKIKIYSLILKILKNFFKNLLPNKLLWVVCLSNFFIYIIRMGIFNWAPTFLYETKGVNLQFAGAQITLFELSGLIGGLLAGWSSDRIFNGKRGQTGFYLMFLLTTFLIIFWLFPTYIITDIFILFIIGFLIYGPQMLSGISGAELVSKKDAATGTGLTGTFGYLGGAFSGIGVGSIAEKLGWNFVFIFFIFCSLIGSICFFKIWKVNK
jgi:sugar phosphate permease